MKTTILTLILTAVGNVSALAQTSACVTYQSKVYVHDVLSPELTKQLSTERDAEMNKDLEQGILVRLYGYRIVACTQAQVQVRVIAENFANPPAFGGKIRVKASAFFGTKNYDTSFTLIIPDDRSGAFEAGRKVGRKTGEAVADALDHVFQKDK